MKLHDTPAREENFFNIPADANPRSQTFTVAMDNYEPVPRKQRAGYIVFYTHTDKSHSEHAADITEERAVVSMSRYGFQFPAVFIMDDGTNVWPMWSGSYNENDEPRVMLFPFPTCGHQRADGKGLASFDNWMLGPRKAYHVKLYHRDADYGERAACKHCGDDIEYHGREYGWSDRGGNYSCNDGHHKHQPWRGE